MLIVFLRLLFIPGSEQTKATSSFEVETNKKHLTLMSEAIIIGFLYNFFLFPFPEPPHPKSTNNLET